MSRCSIRFLPQYLVPFNHLLCELSANTLAESSLLICEVLVSGRDAGRASQEGRGSSQGSSPKMFIRDAHHRE
jgi:hypothetical protein